MENNSEVCCPICLEILKEKNLSITECGHKFHTKCLMQIEGYKCPLCRMNIVDEIKMITFDDVDINKIISLFKIFVAQTSNDKIIEMTCEIDDIVLNNKNDKEFLLCADKYISYYYKNEPIIFFLMMIRQKKYNNGGVQFFEGIDLTDMFKIIL